MASEGLAFGYIGDMHFNGGYLHSAYRVGDSDACMGLAACVYYDTVVHTERVLYLVDDRALAVSLKALDHRFTLAVVLDKVYKVAVGGGAVDLRLAFAEHVKVGTVDNKKS